MTEKRPGRRIKGLVEHYYSHLESFDYVDLARYRRRIKVRLPKYRAYFEAAAKKYKLDWKFVAAQAYQESHWNPRAKSYTGVRGIMMLTRETAASMNLDDRMDVEASIMAGTRYLARLHRQVGESVPEPDRTLMALAAYNIGFGHLQDASNWPAGRASRKTAGMASGRSSRCCSRKNITVPLNIAMHVEMKRSCM